MISLCVPFPFSSILSPDILSSSVVVIDLSATDGLSTDDSKIKNLYLANDDCCPYITEYYVLIELNNKCISHILISYC